MLSETLRQQLMALPLGERIEMAQALWESIVPEAGPGVGDADRAILKEVLRRDAELESGAVAGLAHEEVMEEVRSALERGWSTT